MEKKFFTDPALPLAVVVAATRWDEPPRMRHDVSKQLLRFCNVVFIEYFPSRAADSHTWEPVSGRMIVFRPNVKAVSPRLRANLPWVHTRTNRRWLRVIEEGLGEMGQGVRLLFNFVWEFPEIMGLSGVAWSSYFCFDEFPRMRRKREPRNPVLAHYQGMLFQSYENRVARAATKCFACHRPLYDKLRKAGGCVDYLYHASPYSRVEQNPLRSRATPIQVGYGGHINYRLLDSWLSAVVRQEDMVLHLIGKSEKGYIDRWAGNADVNVHSDLSDREFLDKLREMDVLIMPYDPRIPEVSVMTTNSKTFQYMAAGRPMVMSDLPHYITMPEGVFYKARSAEEFVVAIRKAFEEDGEDLTRLRQETAHVNSWMARGDQIWRAIGEHVPDLAEG